MPMLHAMKNVNVKKTIEKAIFFIYSKNLKP